MKFSFFRPCCRGRHYSRKNNSALAAALALGLALFPAAPALAGETILYEGDGSRLQSTPDGSYDDALFPGTTQTPVASDNDVTVDYVSGSPGTTDPEAVHGGYATTGNAENNSVTILDGHIDSDIFGGSSEDGAVTGNSVTMSGGWVGENIFGGSSEDGAVTNNSVTMSGGLVDERIIGGYSFGSGAVTGNSVTMTGGTVRDGMVVGGMNEADGGVTGNSVSITGGTVGAADSDAMVCGGMSYEGSAAHNSVTISGGALRAADDEAMVIGGMSYEESATNNTVTITGGTLGAADGHTMVAGGFSYEGSATHNAVTISGAPSLTGVMLYGGLSASEEPGAAQDLFTGNTLNLHSAGISVAALNNFQNYNFYLPANLSAGETMITVTGDARVKLGGTTVNVGVEGGSSPLKAGDMVTLIDGTAPRIEGAPVNTTTSGQGMQGITLLYDFDLKVQGDQLLATVTGAGARVNPQTKSLSEGRLAGLAFLDQGYDLLLGPGMGGAMRAVAGDGLFAFGAGAGGWSRYNTGSHMDVSGANLLTGLAWRQPADEGQNGSFLVGAFFEAGWGGYDAYNSFSNAASVKGDGDLNYYGGGVLGRYDFAPTGPGNVYVDASFRAGQVKTDYSSDDLRDLNGEKADYDSSSAYYGAHAGLGYLWNLTDKASLDLSARYMWTHQNSDSVKVLGDPVNFDAVNSQRLRAGARLAYAVNDYVSPYAGAYYDYEFDGQAQASTNGYAIDAPSLKGGTGVGELGLTVKPAADSGFSIDLGVQGYAGVREGVAGSALLRWEF